MNVLFIQGTLERASFISRLNKDSKRLMACRMGHERRKKPSSFIRLPKSRIDL